MRGILPEMKHLPTDDGAAHAAKGSVTPEATDTAADGTADTSTGGATPGVTDNAAYTPTDGAEPDRKGDAPHGGRRLLPCLFLTMLKIGLFAFGGGYAMTALLENELVTKRGWLGQDEFLNMAAIAESTPGPIAVNSATYVGYRLAGVPGAAVASLGVCLPAFLIIWAISLFFDRFVSLTYVAYAFRGVQAAVVYLIASAGIRLFRGLGRDPLGRTLALVTAVALVLLSLFSVRFSAVFFILMGGVVGVAAYLVRRARRGGDGR